jgi:hypothetical protein
MGLMEFGLSLFFVSLHPVQEVRIFVKECCVVPIRIVVCPSICTRIKTAEALKFCIKFYIQKFYQNKILALNQY